MDLHEQLTPHFRLGEFFVTSAIGGQEGLIADWMKLDPLARAAYMQNIRNLAKRLEFIKSEYFQGAAIHIRSGWRSQRVNKLVGGKPKSFHLLGMAADIVVGGKSPKAVQSTLDALWQGGLGYGRTFTHLDTRQVKTRFNYPG
jgi:uncharacterized protein YcbK (DUF882 family)